MVFCDKIHQYVDKISQLVYCFLYQIVLGLLLSINNKNNLIYTIMKTKATLLGLTFFFLGMVISFGIQSNVRHNYLVNRIGVSKRTVIEVGAPLTAAQLKTMNFI